MKPKNFKFCVSINKGIQANLLLSLLVLLTLSTSCTVLKNWKENREEKKCQLCHDLKKCKYGDEFIYVNYRRGNSYESDLDSLCKVFGLSDSSRMKLTFKMPRIDEDGNRMYKTKTIQELNKGYRHSKTSVILENKELGNFKKNSEILETLRNHPSILSANPVCCFVNHTPIVVTRFITFKWEGTDIQELEKLDIFNKAIITRKSQESNWYKIEFDKSMGYDVVKTAKKITKINNVKHVRLSCYIIKSVIRPLN